MESWDTPLTDTFHALRRVAQETSERLGKQVDLTLIGEENVMDKNILQELIAPLLHLIRNAIDHGIETPIEREKLGKPHVGKITLSVRADAENWLIEMQDDGAGIKANEVELIFHPGFSTKTEISEISGRGIGLDIVKTNVEKLGGEVKVITQLQQGSTFQIRVPRSGRFRS